MNGDGYDDAASPHSDYGAEIAGQCLANRDAVEDRVATAGALPERVNVRLARVLYRYVRSLLAID